MNVKWLVALGGIGLALLLFPGGVLMIDRMNGPRYNWLLPVMKLKLTELLRRAKAQGLDVMFWDGWRSPAAEAKDQQKGTSALHDSYASYHTWGAAVDIVFRTTLGEPVWPPTDDPRWAELGKIGQELGLVWGGNWVHLRDMAHFQLAGMSIPDIRLSYGIDYRAWLTSQGVRIA